MASSRQRISRTRASCPQGGRLQCWSRYNPNLRHWPNPWRRWQRRTRGLLITYFPPNTGDFNGQLRNTTNELVDSAVECHKRVVISKTPKCVLPLILTEKNANINRPFAQFYNGHHCDQTDRESSNKNRTNIVVVFRQGYHDALSAARRPN